MRQLLLATLPFPSLLPWPWLDCGECSGSPGGPGGGPCEEILRAKAAATASATMALNLSSLKGSGVV
jgi:hypothetical protein